LGLQLIAAERRPVADRLAERDPRLRGVGAFADCESALELGHLLADAPQCRGRECQQQAADGLLALALDPTACPGRGVDTDVLGHREQPPAVDRLALIGLPRAGEDREQRGLADAVGAHEADVGARGDLERHVGEELITAGMGVGEVGDGDVRHRPVSLPCGRQATTTEKTFPAAHGFLRPGRQMPKTQKSAPLLVGFLPGGGGGCRGRGDRTTPGYPDRNSPDRSLASP
jgi:hypothetical protein